MAVTVGARFLADTCQRAEKPLVDFAVVEAQHLDGDAVRFTKACAEDVAVVISDGDRVACL